MIWPRAIIVKFFQTWNKLLLMTDHSPEHGPKLLISPFKVLLILELFQITIQNHLQSFLRNLVLPV